MFILRAACMAAAIAVGTCLAGTVAFADDATHQFKSGASPLIIALADDAPNGQQLPARHVHMSRGGGVFDPNPASANQLPMVAMAVGMLAVGLAAGLVLGRVITRIQPIISGALVIAVAVAVSGMMFRQVPALGDNGAGQHRSENDRPSSNGKIDHEAQGEGTVLMSPDAIAAASIGLDAASAGAIAQKIPAPGVIVPDAARFARVPAQVVGFVTEMRKRLGDPVAKGEVIAVISSREVADAKSEFLAASVNVDLQKTIYERNKTLLEKQAVAEIQFLQVKETYRQAQLRADLARQKLTALGLDAGTVSAEATEDNASRTSSRLRTYEVRAPMAGQVVERKVDVGTPVGKEGDASDLYAIADLSGVWVELALPLSELQGVKEQQLVTIRLDQSIAEGPIVFISPVVKAETRSARLVVAIDNKDLSWRPGTFVSAEINLDRKRAAVRVPLTALQAIEGKQVVFVRTSKGFEKREVTLGGSDGQMAEITAGLQGGETIAVSNTFLLKAELGKSEAEHSH